jgi:hypothetical protein
MDNTHYISTAVFVRTVNEIISQQMSVELSDVKLIFRNVGFFG